MSAHALLNLLNTLRKIDTMWRLPNFRNFIVTRFINLIIHEHECYILLSYDT